MANNPQELAQDAVCQSHTGHMTELWFLPARPLRLNTNEWMNEYARCSNYDRSNLRVEMGMSTPVHCFGGTSTAWYNEHMNKQKCMIICKNGSIQILPDLTSRIWNAQNLGLCFWTRKFSKSLNENKGMIHSFHWHVQNVTIPSRSQKLLPFLSVMYFSLPPFSTNYSSILSHLILPSISWSTSQSCCSQIHIPFWEFCSLPFCVHAQTNVIYLTLLSLL